MIWEIGNLALVRTGITVFRIWGVCAGLACAHKARILKLVSRTNLKGLAGYIHVSINTEGLAGFLSHCRNFSGAKICVTVLGANGQVTGQGFLHPYSQSPASDVVIVAIRTSRRARVTDCSIRRAVRANFHFGESGAQGAVCQGGGI